MTTVLKDQDDVVKMMIEWIDRLGMEDLNAIIRRVLDNHYPEDIFPWRDNQFGVLWAGERGGFDIDKGVKWVTLLRMALAEVE
jgi:hypothetical protein